MNSLDRHRRARASNDCLQGYLKLERALLRGQGPPGDWLRIPARRRLDAEADLRRVLVQFAIEFIGVQSPRAVEYVCRTVGSNLHATGLLLHDLLSRGLRDESVRRAHVFSAHPEWFAAMTCGASKFPRNLEFSAMYALEESPVRQSWQALDRVVYLWRQNPGALLELYEREFPALSPLLRALARLSFGREDEDVAVFVHLVSSCCVDYSSPPSGLLDGEYRFSQLVPDASVLFQPPMDQEEFNRCWPDMLQLARTISRRDLNCHVSLAISLLDRTRDPGSEPDHLERARQQWGLQRQTDTESSLRRMVGHRTTTLSANLFAGVSGPVRSENDYRLGENEYENVRFVTLLLLVTVCQLVDWGGLAGPAVDLDLQERRLQLVNGSLPLRSGQAYPLGLLTVSVAPELGWPPVIASLQDYADWLTSTREPQTSFNQLQEESDEEFRDLYTRGVSVIERALAIISSIDAPCLRVGLSDWVVHDYLQQVSTRLDGTRTHLSTCEGLTVQRALFELPNRRARRRADS